jgi:hypothetical protein
MSEGEAYDIEKSFLYPINYNWILNACVIGQWISSTAVGMWGMFWYNDGGEMWNEAFHIGVKGGMAEFLEAE